MKHLLLLLLVITFLSCSDQKSNIPNNKIQVVCTTGMIGDAAKNQAAMNPINTVFDAKRLIGRRFSDRQVQSDLKSLSYKVTGKDDKPVLNVKFKQED